jgi:hypothetical protein
MLRRAYEHFVSSLGAVVLTTLLLVSVDSRAAGMHNTLTPSVTILVPTVTIEAVDAIGNGQ